MESLHRLSGLEFSSCEIVVGNRPCDLTPEYILSQPKQAARDCMAFRTIAPSVCFFDIEPDDPDYFNKFEACCELAKQLRVFTISIRSAELAALRRGNRAAAQGQRYRPSYGAVDRTADPARPDCRVL